MGVGIVGSNEVPAIFVIRSAGSCARSLAGRELDGAVLHVQEHRVCVELVWANDDTLLRRSERNRGGDLVARFGLRGPCADGLRNGVVRGQFSFAVDAARGALHHPDNRPCRIALPALAVPHEPSEARAVANAVAVAIDETFCVSEVGALEATTGDDAGAGRGHVRIAEGRVGVPLRCDGPRMLRSSIELALERMQVLRHRVRIPSCDRILKCTLRLISRETAVADVSADGPRFRRKRRVPRALRCVSEIVAGALERDLDEATLARGGARVLRTLCLRCIGRLRPALLECLDDLVRIDRFTIKDVKGGVAASKREAREVPEARGVFRAPVEGDAVRFAERLEELPDLPVLL